MPLVKCLSKKLYIEESNAIHSRVSGRSRYGLTGHRPNSSLGAQLRKQVRLMGRKSERREGGSTGRFNILF